MQPTTSAPAWPAPREGAGGQLRAARVTSRPGVRPGHPEEPRRRARWTSSRSTPRQRLMRGCECRGSRDASQSPVPRQEHRCAPASAQHWVCSQGLGIGKGWSRGAANTTARQSDGADHPSSPALPDEPLPLRSPLSLTPQKLGPRTNVAGSVSAHDAGQSDPGRRATDSDLQRLMSNVCLKNMLQEGFGLESRKSPKLPQSMKWAGRERP